MHSCIQPQTTSTTNFQVPPNLNEPRDLKKLSIEERRNQEQSKPIQQRNFFILGEVIKGIESDTIEYKDYKYPFDEERELTLLRTMCGFLNNRGGFIFIGLHDTGKVTGVTFSFDVNDRRRYQPLQLQNLYCDNLRLRILSIADTIRPPIRGLGILDVQFLDVKRYEDLSDLVGTKSCVVRIAVSEGTKKPYLTGSYHFRENGRNVIINPM